MIVDVATHVWDSPEQLGPETAARYRRACAVPWDRPDAAPIRHDQAMERVRYAIIHGLVSAASGAAVGPEQVARYVARRPGKYLGCAGIDPTADDSLAQLDAACQLGLVGVTVSPQVQHCLPMHPLALALYERCAARGLPVFVHPGLVPTAEARMDLGQPVHWDEVARTFPTLRLVLGQAGHPWVEQTLALLAKHDHVYAELSGVVGRPWQLYHLLVAAHEQSVADRLLLGSGFPLGTPQQAIHAIQAVNALAHGTSLPQVPAEELHGIVERDALACLGVARPSGSATDAADGDTGPDPAALGPTAAPSTPRS